MMRRQARVAPSRRESWRWLVGVGCRGVFWTRGEKRIEVNCLNTWRKITMRHIMYSYPQHSRFKNIPSMKTPKRHEKLLLHLLLHQSLPPFFFLNLLIQNLFLQYLLFLLPYFHQPSICGLFTGASYRPRRCSTWLSCCPWQCLLSTQRNHSCSPRLLRLLLLLLGGEDQLTLLLLFLLDLDVHKSIGVLLFLLDCLVGFDGNLE